MSGARVLIVDDELGIRRALSVALTDRGYATSAVASGEEAIAAVERARPDVIVLDLAMPGIGGLEACKRIRLRWPVPIVVLSVMGKERDKVEALNAGADDYLTKPFGMDELEARLRVAQRHAAALVSNAELVFRSGDLIVDIGKRRVLHGGEDVHLTPTEYDVLKCLVSHAGNVVTHSTILSTVWGPEYTSDTQPLRYTMVQLRKKLHDSPINPRYLFTDPGVGYRFQVDP